MERARSSWGFDVRDLDKRVRPQDDFYRYAAGGWLARHPIPKEESRWGSFTKLRRETDHILWRILRSIGQKRRRLSERERQLADFFRSGMDVRTRDRRGLAPVARWLEEIAKMKTASDLVRTIGALERAGVGAPWGLFIDQDSKRSDRYVIHLYQSGLSMPDRDYYLKDDAESTRVHAAYRQHLEKMWKLAGVSGPEVARRSSVVLAFETALARASMHKEDARDSEKTYHAFSPAGLRARAPAIDWRLYFSSIGTKMPRTLVVMQPDFLKAVSRLVRTLPLEEWRVYLAWQLVNGVAPYLSSRFERQHFAFYGTALAGVTHMRPLWRRVQGAVDAHLGELLGRFYVNERFGAAARRRIHALVDDVVAAYRARLTALDWMGTATKRRALAKLRRMGRKLGYPSRWKSYAGLVVRPDDYAGNALRANAYELRRRLRKLGKPIDRAEWHMHPQTVNAYCNFTMNEIVFPAAILQPPFFDPRADDALNYGAIGAVIGHEITHGFDDQGSKFDAGGNLKRWWSAGDRRRFERRARRLVRQFDRYRVADGVAVNGALTLGENIADLGGIAIAYDAYRRRLRATGRRMLGGFAPEQRFFFGATLFDRANERPEFAKTLALTDPHSPAEFRINGPLSNLPEFYDAFGVSRGNRLYRNARSRAKIW